MTRSVAACLLAVLIPGVALMAATPAGRAAPPPFGTPDLLAAHLLAALPLAAWLGRRLAIPDGFAAGAGVVTCLLAANAGDPLPEAAGFVVRSAVRSTGCLLLALPWCCLAGAGPTTRLGLAAGLVAGFAAPPLFADRVAAGLLTDARDRLDAGRLVAGRGFVDAACDVAPGRTLDVAGKPTPLPQVRRELDATITDLRKKVARPPTAKTPPAGRLAFARALLALDRPADAAAAVRALPGPDARFVEAEAHQHRGAWADSDAALRAGLADGGPSRTAFDNLARNAQERGDFAAAEAAFRDGLAALPADAAHFRFQLGRLFAARGRPVDALAEFAAAEALDSAFGPRAEPFVRRLRESTPGCLVGRP